MFIGACETEVQDMQQYGAYSDDYYVNVHVNTEMDLPSSRETILHHFERLQKRYPSMQHFYSRERQEFVLEEEKEKGTYRWASVDPKRVCSGFVNPPDLNSVAQLHRDVFELVPYTLALTPMDCESLNLMFGFDYTFRGNQNEVVANALGLPTAFEKLRDIPGASLLGQDPSIQLALDEDCRTQLRISIETRTTAYQVRTKDFPEEQLSAYLTCRRFGSLELGETFVEALDRLYAIAEDFLDRFMVSQVLVPLQQSIAARG